MTATTADVGYGSTFGIGAGDPLTYTNVAEVTMITPPGYSRDPVEATHLTSDDGYKEFIAGMKETGDASFTLNWVPSATDLMVTAFESDVGNYRIVAPNGVFITFRGFFTSYEIGDLDPNGKMNATVTVKISGKPTMNAAA